MTYVVDTNVLLRTFQPTHAMYGAASRSIALLVRQNEKLCILPQSIYECWVVATRPVAMNGLGMTVAQIQVEIASLKKHFSFLPDIPDIYPLWEQLVSRHAVVGKPAHDARIVAAMMAHGVPNLLTFNLSDFTRYPGITPVSPNSIVSPPAPASNP